MAKRTVVTFLWVVLISTLATAQTAKYSLTPGTTYIVDSSLKQVISQIIMGSANEMTNTTSTKEKLVVESESNGIFTLSITNLYQRAEIVTPMGTQIVDSEDESSEGGLFPAIVNTSYTFTMDEYGKIMGIDGLEALIESVSTSLGNNPELNTQVAAIFDEETIRSNLENRFTIYPLEDKTAWSVDKERTLNNLPFKISTDYTLAGNTLQTEGTLTVSGSIQQMGMQVKMEMSGTQTGKYELFADSGMPSNIVSSSDISGTANAQGMDIPMTIGVETTTNITKQ